MLFRISKLATATLLCLCYGCSTEVIDDSQPLTSRTIKATINGPALTRTTIDLSDINDEDAPVQWTPGDALGVFTESNVNVRYEIVNRLENVYEGTFATAESISEEPQYVYYPYNSVNAGKAYNQLQGTIPQTQPMNLLTGSIPGDYKYGELKATYSDGFQFNFHSMFSLALLNLDATGTALEGDRLIASTVKVTRNGVSVPICGDFTFNAADGSYTPSSSSSNVLNIDWTTSPVLDKTVSSFATMFPELKEGDSFEFVILTDSHQAILTLTSLVDFQPGCFYTFPLTLSKYGTDKMSIVERTDVAISGTFTCATYNVDGLPEKVSFITINEGGPGSEGTKAISKKIAADDWDFVGFSEDFEYNSELQSELSSNYTFGTHAGSYSTSSTDGLNFAVRSSNGVSYSGEQRISFESSYGGLTSGANTSITKGFRHYVVALADGTEIDVIITHMNTYSSSGTGHINAQHEQLKQIAQYIKDNQKQRPVIFMGDTNLRYTRHDFETYFFSVLASATNLTVNDPWIDYMWDGVYPTYPSNSICVEDITGASSTDVIYSNQKGEVVDKIIYINDSNASVQISANGYLRDMNYSGLADHCPIVVEFYYEKTK